MSTGYRLRHVNGKWVSRAERGSWTTYTDNEDHARVWKQRGHALNAARKVGVPLVLETLEVDWCVVGEEDAVSTAQAREIAKVEEWKRRKADSLLRQARELEREAKGLTNE